MQIELLAANFSVIPLIGKKPIWKDWTKYKNKKPDFELLKNHNDNFGIVCGFEGLEVIDIDNHFGNSDALLAFVEDNISLSDFLVIKTGGGGYHIYYKCDNPKSSQVLARRKFIGSEKNGVLPDGKEVILSEKNGEWFTNVTMVETRGDGGQVCFYDNIIRGSIDSVPKISDEKRDQLFEICKALNEVAEKVTSKRKENIKVDGQLPGDAYNNDPDAINETFQLLLENGWTTTNNSNWWRPGKKFQDGPSATFGRVGTNRFYNFSTNAHPFQDKESYSLMGVRAVLKHGGDFSKCAKELAEIYNIDVKEPEKKEKKNKWKVLDDIIKDWKLKFRYNQLTSVIDVSKKGKSYEKIGLLVGDIVKEMETKRGVRSISSTKVKEMIENTDICHVYNPVMEFFKGLPVWDGVDYFAELRKYIVLAEDENEEFFFSMLKKHIIRTIKCVRYEKYINRMVFVLHGPQEIGKSEFFRWLLPSKELYNEEPVHPSEKDSILALGRYVLINMDELDELNKKEVSKMKAFISRGTITKRVAYGRHDENFPRIASFVASTNKSDVLADENNTRWIILKIVNFDWKGYVKNINPLQIWAQCLKLLNEDNDSGELTFAEKQERDNRNAAEFLEISSEREILHKYFEAGNTPMTTTDIKILIENKKHPIKINIYQLKKELRRSYGEPSKPTRINGKQGRYYYIKTSLFEDAFNLEYADVDQVGQDAPF
jgi:hypothetical protein